MPTPRNRIYGLLKPSHDAHSIGVQSVSDLLLACGYEVRVAEHAIERALSYYYDEQARQVIADWVRQEQIQHLGISYRLDASDAVKMVGHVLDELQKQQLLAEQGGPVQTLFFAGLVSTCEAVTDAFGERILTFQGGESPAETLRMLQVPGERIPAEIIETGQYDSMLHDFAEEIITTGEYHDYQPTARQAYPEFGTPQDSLVKRLASVTQNGQQTRPLIRAHVGPYDAEQPRRTSIDEGIRWARSLADAGLLDILSLGTSQLSQSNFGENWSGKINGGGVPVNSAEEYVELYEAARPMLVRTYAGTKNMEQLARLYEETINICWHALSFWWFNKLDDRGPYDLYRSLQEQFRTLRTIASYGTPFEANVPHHFAFRGTDDVSYIVSAFLAAKAAKQAGIKTFILQNMLNTPRATWGVQDLARSRALLHLIRPLVDQDFQVYLQPRAGLDYFKPDLQEARIQLAAVTCLMDDIDPHNASSPPLIHVVSYSEASHLATPDVVNESIRITQHSLATYRRARRSGLIDDMSRNAEVSDRQDQLIVGAEQLIHRLERTIPDLYSPEGFYLAFCAGFLPVPYLWNELEEFEHAVNWQTKLIQGSTQLVDNSGKPLAMGERLAQAEANIADAECKLRLLRRWG